ncbi:MAG: anaerobic glycerol-3-phosphate dehydrogenase subunit C [Planctomycetia bacterium]|nr:anaerobic glycerol-3-phosphate dehydrogenase subunit C [Planctomycetia bacterium]
MTYPAPEQLADDLKGVIQGELLLDDLSRTLYSTDASIFQVQPLGVVVPRHEDDVRALVKYAAEHQVPLTPRGAGSGMAGEALGAGLIVDLSRHFRSILHVGRDTVRVQPGVVYRDLNLELAKIGRRFAPDPASGAQCTIGGMLANNASGSRALKFGYSRDHTAALRVVFDTGDAAWVAQEPRRPIPDHPGGRAGEVAAAIVELLERNAELIQTCRPRTLFNRCGYLLHDVLGVDRIDLARLLVGSEGTLGLFTEAILRTVPLPAGRAVVLLGFGSLEAAVKATQRALPSGPAACEVVDRRLLTLARSVDPLAASLVPPAVETALVVEYECDTQTEATQAALQLRDLHQRGGQQALIAIAAVEPERIERLWRLRELALPSLYGLRGGPQPLPCVEDVAVPVDELAGYLRRVQEILKRFEVSASFLIHAGSGQVHTRPFLDMQRPDDVQKLWPLAGEIHTLALELGGTVSTQHGTGLARTPWVEKQYGRLYPVFRELKAIFDPQGIFNPGKIIGPAPGLPAWPLRKVASAPESSKAPSEGSANETNAEALKPAGGSSPANGHWPQATALRWKPSELHGECLSCNGCGGCRTEAPGERMCPIFRATHTEAATPRAKANLMRFLLDESTDSRLLTSDNVRETADLCVNCKMCAVECPAHVNIPKLMLEAKAAHVAEHGLNRFDWVLARTEMFARWGSSFAFLANALLKNEFARWLLEKVFGVSRQRRLHPFAGRSFLRRAARRGWTRRRAKGDGPRVVYFVDVFANYNDPQIAEATVAVLQHNGIDVYVPPDQVGCGMAPLAYGDVETARETATHNLRILADQAREGHPIVCSEPTAALMLKHDYPNLIDDPDTQLVAERTVELTAYLAQLHRAGRLKTDFKPLTLSLGHHVPCHLKALGGPPLAPDLLSLIPGLRVHKIDVSCSGMAGTFGLRNENYEPSLAAGKPMLDQLRKPNVFFGSTECSTCRLQMEEGSGKRTLHPAQYLALAYGLMPELAKRLRS